MEEMTNNRYRC